MCMNSVITGMRIILEIIREKHIVLNLVYVVQERKIAWIKKCGKLTQVLLGIHLRMFTHQMLVYGNYNQNAISQIIGKQILKRALMLDF